MDDFRRAVDMCKLNDLGYSGNPFIWGRKNKTDGFIVERLDRFLATSSFIEKLKNIALSHTNKHNSDRNGLLVDLNQNINKKPRKGFMKSIRFEESWTKFEECRLIISRCWKEMPISRPEGFERKLIGCLVKLRNWNKIRLNGSLKAAISRKEEELKALISRLGLQHDSNIRVVKQDLENLLEEEEKYWKARSREDWLNH